MGSREEALSVLYEQLVMSDITPDRRKEILVIIERLERAE